MSRENVKKFFELVKTEEQLARKVVELNEGMRTGKFSTETELIENHILPLAKKHGLEFTMDEFLEYSQASVGELSDDMLLDVNGGANAIAKAVAWTGLFLTASSFIPSIAASWATGGGGVAPETSISQTYEKEMEDEDNDEDDDTVTPQNSPIFRAQRRADAGGPGAFNMDEVMQKLRSVDGATAQPGSGVAATQATVDRNGAGDAAVETKLETQKSKANTNAVTASEEEADFSAQSQDLFRENTDEATTAVVKEEATEETEEHVDAINAWLEQMNDGDEKPTGPAVGDSGALISEGSDAGAVVEDGIGTEAAGAVKASEWAPLVAGASYANRVENLLTGIDSYNKLDEESQKAVNAEAGELKNRITGSNGNLILKNKNGKVQCNDSKKLKKIVDFYASHSKK